jgi:hypothetical protein
LKLAESSTVTIFLLLVWLGCCGYMTSQPICNLLAVIVRGAHHELLRHARRNNAELHNPAVAWHSSQHYGSG